jgi:hypothetical protein
MITVQKTGEDISNSFNYLPCESSVNKCLQIGGGHFEHYL